MTIRHGLSLASTGACALGVAIACALSTASAATNAPPRTASPAIVPSAPKPGSVAAQPPSVLHADLVVDGNGIQIGNRFAQFGTTAPINSTNMTPITPKQQAQQRGQGPCHFTGSFAVKNAGAVQSEAVDVYSWAEQPQGPQVGKIGDMGYGNPALAPGARQTWTFALDLVPGSYVFHVVIDPKRLNRQYTANLIASCGLGTIPQMRAPNALAPAGTGIGGTPAGTAGTQAAPHFGIGIKKAPAPAQAHVQAPPTNAPVPGVHAVAATPASFFPATLNFGSLWSGDRRKLSANVQLRDDTPAGEFTASLSSTPGPVFRIVQVQVYGTPSRGTVQSMAPIGRGAERQAPAARSQGPKAVVQPTAQLASSRTLLASSTTPPFTLAAKGGDRIVVMVESSPVLNLFNGPTAGTYEAKLQLSAKSWSAAIPVAETFNGLKTGVIPTLDTYDPVVYVPEAYTPGDKTTVSVGMTLVNTDKSAHSVAISANGLPSGFSLVPQREVVGAGKTVKLIIPFTVTWGIEEGEKKADLEVSYEGGKKTIVFGFNVIPSVKMFYYSGSDKVDWQLFLTVHSNGKYDVSWHVNNDNVAFARQFMFDISWNNQISLGKPVGHVDRVSTSDDTYKLGNSMIQVSYPEIIQMPPTVSFTATDVFN